VKVRVIYTKGDRVRFLGHLDVYRVLRMALKRAKWPVAMSQGFSPKPKLSLYAPLPVGTAGFNEVMDVELSEQVSIDCIFQSFEKEIPSGFQLVSIFEVPDKKDSLEPKITGSLYDVDLGVIDIGALRTALSTFCQETSVILSIHRPKKERVLDLRPLVVEAEAVSEDPEDNQRPERKGGMLSPTVLRLLIAHHNGRTIRPAWVLEALSKFGFECDPREAIIDRRKILFDNSRDTSSKEGIPEKTSQEARA
jgi:radical SAM-linked protein